MTFVQLMYMGSGIADSEFCNTPNAQWCHYTANDLAYFKGSIGKHVGAFINDPLVFKPGTNYSYANANYYLLSYMVEKISGQSFGSYLKQNIFDKIAAVGRQEGQALGDWYL
ncbi:hypothetical protein P43SY_011742 [Pythium insidiosum]|uniref:Beta-lactamase-related domain-containing protein n=1 Tax=Pythium insidiosum TaxID=114742 RepID=A0AAD5LQ09_PYTIN|nr:hypothetical protein P43SY_011742 [Pythium insidiosum]